MKIFKEILFLNYSFLQEIIFEAYLWNFFSVNFTIKKENLSAFRPGQDTSNFYHILRLQKEINSGNIQALEFYHKTRQFKHLKIFT